MPRARRLIDVASYEADTIAILRRIFDEVWASVAHDYGGDPEEIEEARIRLATIILALAKDDQLGPPEIERTARRLIYQASREQQNKSVASRCGPGYSNVLPAISRDGHPVTHFACTNRPRQEKGTDMQLAENILVEELDRLIHSATMRIEQQRFHVAESSASPSQVLDAKQVLKQMIDGLRQLKLRRAQFA